MKRGAHFDESRHVLRLPVVRRKAVDERVDGIRLKAAGQLIGGGREDGGDWDSCCRGRGGRVS